MRLRSGVGWPWPVPLPRSRPFRAWRTAYRRRWWPSVPSAPRPAMANGDAPAQAPAGPSALCSRRRAGVTGRGASGTHRSTAWLPGGHQRPLRDPAPAPGAARGRQQPRACGTWHSFPQRSTLVGLVAISQKARVAHGALDGDDGLLARRCGVGAVSADRLYGFERFILQRLKEMRLQGG
jgi:hypothetical protein